MNEPNSIGHGLRHISMSCDLGCGVRTEAEKALWITLSAMLGIVLARIGQDSQTRQQNVDTTIKAPSRAYGNKI